MGVLYYVKKKKDGSNTHYDLAFNRFFYSKRIDDSFKIKNGSENFTEELTKKIKEKLDRYHRKKMKLKGNDIHLSNWHGIVDDAAKREHNIDEVLN